MRKFQLRPNCNYLTPFVSLAYVAGHALLVNSLSSSRIFLAFFFQFVICPLKNSVFVLNIPETQSKKSDSAVVLRRYGDLRSLTALAHFESSKKQCFLFHYVNSFLSYYFCIFFENHNTLSAKHGREKR